MSFVPFTCFNTSIREAKTAMQERRTLLQGVIHSPKLIPTVLLSLPLSQLSSLRRFPVNIFSYLPLHLINPDAKADDLHHQIRGQPPHSSQRCLYTRSSQELCRRRSFGKYSGSSFLWRLWIVRLFYVSSLRFHEWWAVADEKKCSHVCHGCEAIYCFPQGWLVFKVWCGSAAARKAAVDGEVWEVGRAGSGVVVIEWVNYEYDVYL